MNTIQEFYYWEMTTQDTIDVKKIYIDIADDLVAGILLSQIIYWNLPNKQGGSKLRIFKEDKYWLAKRRDEWYDEIRISPKQYDRGIKILESLKLVEVKLFKFNGLPAPHIHLNEEQLLLAVNTMLEKNISNPCSPFVLPKGKNENSPKVKMGIPQIAKPESTNGENEFLPKGEMGINQMSKSLTENTTKITSIFENAKAKMKQELTKVSFNTWIEPIQFIKIDGLNMILEVETEFSKNIIEQRYKLLIEKTIKAEAGEKYSIIFVTKV